MIQLEDSVFIAVPPERVWTWLNELPQHYRDWHPAHVNCRFERGQRLEVGTILRIDEELHGRAHTLRLRATAVEPARLLRYSNHGYRGAFILEPASGGTRFRAELCFGTKIPVLGTLIDLVLRRVLGRRLAAIESHMREEGQNLKRLLESAPREP